MNEELKKQITTKDEALELICDIANDYDGCRTVESLKELVDELADIASYARTL